MHSARQPRSRELYLKSGAVKPLPKTPSRPLHYWILQTLRYSILVLFAVIFLGPLFWVISLAVKTEAEFSVNPLGLPMSPQWGNFARAWDQGHFSIYLPNTIIYATSVVLLIAIFACMAGYALAKVRFPGSNIIFGLFLLGLTLPFLSIMIPLFYLARDLNILGTQWGFIIPAVAMGLPFSIFLMRAFFMNIPNELGDAARVDGCSEWGVFYRVMLPLAWPGLATVAVFEFLGTWSAYLMPLILVQRDELRPVALALPLFQGRYRADLPLIAAASLISIGPPLLIYLFLQRRFIQGVTAGALK